MAHGEKRMRMLQIQTLKSPQTFNHHPNIRTLTSPQNPMPTRSSAFYTRHYVFGQAACAGAFMVVFATAFVDMDL
jgi:hypothetical protein